MPEESDLHSEETIPPQQPAAPAPAARAESARDVGRGDGPGSAAVQATIGRYRVIRQIGEGGMGAVFEAEQDKPRRAVALKIINAGAISGKLLRRFEAEAEILGRLQHPGIAQIYEAGMFGEGAATQPFFAMELIDGAPLTEYAQQQKLGTRDRLALMVRICEAVQHAHQRGVIHRDLKPGNILVDTTGQPKVLDFGVARATDGDIHTTTLRTDIGQLIGTIPYMSPEQAAGDPNDIDTRSDVYALGVIAYQLLAGRLPHELGKTMIHEAVRVIREDEPMPLSSIDRTFRGDVETIIGKALAKEKDRRYASASALQADLQRYLIDEPIAARPPSAWYQVRKFSRRNKALVIGVTATFVALVVGLIGTITFAAGEAEQRRLAEDSALAARLAQDEAEAARAEEALRAEELQQVADFQAEQLGGIDVQVMATRLREDLLSEARTAWERAGLEDEAVAERAEQFQRMLAGANLTNVALKTLDRNIFDRALAAVQEQFAEQEFVKARLLQTLADTLLELGLLDEARGPQFEALQIRRRVLGDEHADTLLTINNMGMLLRRQDKLAEAEPYIREALEGYRRVLGDEDANTLTTVINMGILLQSQGRLAEAEPYYRDALEGYRRVLGDEHPYTLNSIDNMGILLQSQGRLAEAEPYIREALETRGRVLGDEHPDTLNSVNSMGRLLRIQARLAEAEPYYRDALEGRRRVLGDEHPDTLTSVNNMAVLLSRQGKDSEAESYYRAAMEGRRRVLGDDHSDTLNSLINMGVNLARQGKPAEAETYVRDALEGYRRVLGDEHLHTLKCVHTLGRLLQIQNRLAEAEPYLLEALETRRRVLGNEHPDTLASLSTVGVLLKSQGRMAEVEPYLREALETRRRVLGDEHPNTLNSVANLGVLLYLQGKLAEAEPFLREALEGQRRVLGDEHRSTLSTINSMSALLNGQGRYDKAEALVREFLPHFDAGLGAEDWRTAEARSLLGEALAGLERYDEAEPLLLDAHAGLEAALPESRRAEKLDASIRQIVKLYDAWGKPDEAARWRARLEALNSTTDDTSET